MKDNYNDIKEQMIALIEKNRISSVEVADALGKTGVLDGINIFNPGKSCVGEVQYIFGHSESNWPIHEQAHHLKEGGIVYVDTFECNNKAAFGDLVSKYLMLYKRMKGMVVNGLLRDAHTIRKENYSAWCTGVTPLGCNNVDMPIPSHVQEEAKKRKEYFDGSIMVCDDSGCTVISKENINEQTLKKLEFMELQEDIWYYCLDTLKWSTYEIVCLKKYLENKHELPAVLVEKFKELSS
jgi:4-hydroxy-4-methyl-2-oxoglutarate aldolase